jgi:hypothetical protein
MVHTPSGSRQPHLKTIVAFSRHDDLERRQYIEGRLIKLIKKLQELVSSISESQDSITKQRKTRDITHVLMDYSHYRRPSTEFALISFLPLLWYLDASNPGSKAGTAFLPRADFYWLAVS